MLMPSIFGENLFDDFFNDFPFYNDKDMKRAERKLYGHRAKNLMKTDIKEKNDSFVLEMELPGFKKDEIKVSLENGYLTVQAAKGLDKDEQEKKSGRYIRQERYTGSCSRTFYVGDMKPSDVAAKYEDGILKISLPKVDQKKLPESTSIAIG